MLGRTGGRRLLAHCGAARALHTAPPRHLVDTRLLARVAAQGERPPTVRDLVEFSRSQDSRRLIKSAQYLHRELPSRLAACLVRYNQLPFIVGCNPHLQTIYSMYADAFSKLQAFPQILTAADEERFAALLGKFIDHHMVVPHLLASACQECRGVVSKEVLGE